MMKTKMVKKKWNDNYQCCALSKSLKSIEVTKDGVLRESAFYLDLQSIILLSTDTIFSCRSTIEKKT